MTQEIIGSNRNQRSVPGTSGMPRASQTNNDEILSHATSMEDSKVQNISVATCNMPDATLRMELDWEDLYLEECEAEEMVDEIEVNEGEVISSEITSVEDETAQTVEDEGVLIGAGEADRFAYTDLQMDINAIIDHEDRVKRSVHSLYSKTRLLDYIETNTTQYGLKWEQSSELLKKIQKYLIQLPDFYSIDQVYSYVKSTGLLHSGMHNDASRYVTKRLKCNDYPAGLTVMLKSGGKLQYGTHIVGTVVYCRYNNAFKLMLILPTRVHIISNPFDAYFSQSCPILFDDSSTIIDMGHIKDELSNLVDYKSYCREKHSKRVKRSQENNIKHHVRDEKLAARLKIQESIYTMVKDKVSDAIASSINYRIEQSLSSIADISEAIKAKVVIPDVTTDIFTSLLSKVENFIMFFIQSMDCTNMKGLIVSIVRYLKTFNPDKLIVANIFEQLSSLVTHLSEYQDEVSEVKSSYTSSYSLESILSYADVSLESGIGGAKTLFKIWKDARSSDTMAKFHTLIHSLLYLGFMPEQWKDDEANTLNIFNMISYNIQSNFKSSLDLWETMIDSIIYFIDKIYLCCKTGTISSLKYDDECMARMVQRAEMCITAYTWVQSDKIDVFEYNGTSPFRDNKEWRGEVDSIFADLLKLQKAEMDNFKKNSQVVAHLTVILRKLTQVIQDYEVFEKRETVQMKPFGILICGPSSIGKSTVKTLMINAVAKAINISSDDKCINVHNGNDKFNSNYKATHTITVFDDLMNETVGTFKGENPLNCIIKFFNNIPADALKADVAEKGKYVFNGHLGIVTTNVPDLKAGYFSNEPLSILRRMEVHCEMKLRDEFTNDCNNLNGEKMQMSGINDAWCIDIYQWIDGKSSSVTNSAKAAVGQRSMHDHMVKKTESRKQVKFASSKIINADGVPVTGTGGGSYATPVKKYLHRNVSITQACMIVAEMAQKQREIEKKLIKSMTCCKHTCPIHFCPMKIHEGFELTRSSPVENFYCQVCTGEVELKPIEKVPDGESTHDFYGVAKTRAFEVENTSFISARDNEENVNEEYEDEHVDQEFMEGPCTSIQDILNFTGIRNKERSIEEGYIDDLKSRVQARRDELVCKFKTYIQHLESQLEFDKYLVDLSSTKEQTFQDDLIALEELKYDVFSRDPNKSFHYHALCADKLLMLLYDKADDCKRKYRYTIEKWRHVVHNKKHDCIIRLQKLRIAYESIIEDVFCFDSDKPSTWFSTFIDVLSERKSEMLKIAGITVGVTASVITCAKLVKFMFSSRMSITEEQKCIVPTPIERPEEPKVIVPPVKPKKTDLHIYSNESKTVNLRDLERIIVSSMGTISLKLPDSDMYTRCSACPVGHNYWIVPKHTLTATKVFERTVPYELIYGLNDKSTSRKGFITSKDIVPINKVLSNDSKTTELIESDLMLVCLKSVGSAPSLLSFIPLRYEGMPKRCSMARVLHDKVVDSNGVEVSQILQTIDVVSAIEMKAHPSGQVYKGFDYYTTKARTARGWCGSLIYDISGGLIGYHLTGEVCDPDKSSMTRSGGSAQFLDRFSIDKAIATMNLQMQQSINLVCPHIPDKIVAYKKHVALQEVVYDKHCLVRAEDIGNVIVLGSHNNGRSTLRTNIKEFGYDKEVEKHLGFPKLHVIPNNVNLRIRGITMAGEYDRDFNLIKKTSSDFDPHLLDTCMDEYLADIVDRVDMEKWREQLAVHTVDVAVNGVDGITSVNGLDMSTSSGFHLPGSKKKYVDKEGFSLSFSKYSYQFSDLVLNEVRKLESDCKQGKRFCHISKCCIKDEPLKSDKQKLRIMNAFDVSTTILFKQYTGSLVRFFYDHWDITECCSGINPYKDWPRIADIMRTFGSDKNVLAGDFSNFDKRMSSQMILAAFTILKRLASYGMYTEDELKVFDVLAYECAFPIYDYDGVLILANGSNPSGNPLTVIINSIVNSLYMRMAFRHIYPDMKYSDNVRSLMYGDDSLITVNVDNCPEFCYNRISEFLATADIKWTDSFKSADLASRYFDDLETIDFLKRGFRYDTELGRWMCPLSTTSFSKMLNFHSLKTSHVQVKNLFLLNLDTMLTEYAFYGRQAYGVMVNNVKNLLQELSVFDDTNMFSGEKHYPSWEERIAQLTNYVHLHPHEAALLTFLSTIGTQEFQCKLIYHENLTDSQRNACTGSSNLSRVVDPLSTPNDFIKGTNKETEEKLVMPLSALPCVSHEGLQELQDETISYYDENNRDINLVSGLDPSYTAGDDNLTIQEFLSRPIRIGNFRWEQLTETRYNLDPWFAFLSNSRVKQKLEHYRHIRGNLMIKVTINGNKFFAGSLMMSYDPLATSANGTLIEGNDLNANFAYMLGSQRPHAYMDPNTNCGCTMHLPFIYPYDYIDLVAINSLSMGLLRFIDLCFLTATEPDATGVNVNIYAYMTDVNVCTPTYFTMGEIAQSDEYSDSPISSTATAIAAAAGNLTTVPLIGNAARATQSTFGVVAALAKLAGFSKPPKIDSYTMAKSTTASSIATFNGVDLSEKLTMDIKQEVNLDPAILGAPKVDELGIKYLCEKESYLKQFTWSPSDPEGAILGVLPVTPVYYYKLVRDGLDPLISMTPSALVAMNFKYWRAEMCYRLKLVASTFHSGRIRIVYDPIAPVLQLDRINTTYSWVLDLKENPEHCMDVGWGSGRKYLKCAAYDQPIFSGASSLLLDDFDPDSNAFNGFLTIFVENPLVVPSNSNTPVRIVTFAKAKNARFGLPNGSQYLNYSVTPRISSYEPQAETRSDGPVETVHSEKLPHVTDYVGGIFFGEEIESLRCILKRSTQAYSVTKTNLITAVNLRSIIVDHFPQMPYPAGSIRVGADSVPTRWFPTPLDVISKCYVARRGSVRWKINYEATGIPGNVMEIGLNSEPKYGNVTLPASTTDLMAVSISTQRAYELSGARVYKHTGGTFSTCEIEVPHYHNARFIPARNFVNYQPLGIAYPFNDMETPTWYLKRASSTTAGYEKIDLACSIGEDFYLGMFVCTPLMYDFSYV